MSIMNGVILSGEARPVNEVIEETMAIIEDAKERMFRSLAIPKELMEDDRR